MPDHEIDYRKMYERICTYQRPEESVAVFRDRCGISQSNDSRWSNGGGISVEKLAYMAERNPEMNLNYIVLDRVSDRGPYNLVERMAADVLDAVKRTLELVPDSGAGTVKLVRQDVPTGNTPHPDTK